MKDEWIQALGTMTYGIYVLTSFYKEEINDKFNPGNHTLFVAEVVDAKVMATGQPLSSLDYDGVYLGKN